MTDRLRTIRLYGKLGARFGRRFRLAVNSPAEAVHALCTMLPGFQQYLMGAKAKGMEFAVFNGRQNLSRDQLHDPPGQDDIRVAPVMVGSKRGRASDCYRCRSDRSCQHLWRSWRRYSSRKVLGSGRHCGLEHGIGRRRTDADAAAQGIGAKDSPESMPSHSMNGTVNTQAQGNPCRSPMAAMTARACSSARL